MYYCANAFVVTITLQIYTIILSKKKIYTIIIHMQICFLILYLLIYTQRDKRERERERERERGFGRVA